MILMLSQARRRSADDERDEDENQVCDRGYDLQLLPVHSTRAAVLVRHVRAHRRRHTVADRVAAYRSRYYARHRILHRVHNHLLAGEKDHALCQLIISVYQTTVLVYLIS